jgi:hypothetical protein
VDLREKVKILDEKIKELNRVCEKYGVMVMRSQTHISLCNGNKIPPMAYHLGHIQLDMLIRMSEEDMENCVIRCCLDAMSLTGQAGNGAYGPSRA